jgi:hypothetical protein
MQPPAVSTCKEPKMFARHSILSVTVIGLASLALIAASGGARADGPESSRIAQAGMVAARISYQGRVTDHSGKPLESKHNFAFEWWSGPTGGTQFGDTTARQDIPVTDGVFTVDLDVPSDVADGRAIWLNIGVDGARLAPLQELLPVPYALGLRPGATIRTFSTDTVYGLSVLNMVKGSALRVQGVQHGIEARGESGDGVSAVSGGGAETAAVRGKASGAGYGGDFSNSAGIGLHVTGAQAILADSTGNIGSGIYSHAQETAIEGNSVAGFGVEGVSQRDSGVRAESYSDAHPALIATNQSTGGAAAEFYSKSGHHGVSMENVGAGAVLQLKSGGGPFLYAWSGLSEARFRLEGDGNAYADGAWYGGGADVAEMVDASDGVEAGDVLVIGAAGDFEASGAPFQTSVAGVYSTRPGFVGGQPIEGGDAGKVPLAIVGIVPVKVSSENGAIAPGDLLVTSSLRGHAMGAGPNPPLGTVIGKALGTLAHTERTGVIRMLVTLQ